MGLLLKPIEPTKGGRRKEKEASGQTEVEKVEQKCLLWVRSLQIVPSGINRLLGVPGARINAS
jgi:hypothetical protein